MSGTFTIIPNTANPMTYSSAVGGPWASPGAHGPGWEIDTPNTGTLRFIFTGSCISIDGGAAIPFASLPAGFTVVSASVSGGPSRGSGSDHFWMQGGSSEGPMDQSSYAYPGNSSGFPITTPPTILDLYSGGVGVRANAATGYLGSVGDGGFPRISGTYTTASWYFNLATNHYQFTDTPPGLPWVLVGKPPLGLTEIHAQNPSYTIPDTFAIDGEDPLSERVPLTPLTMSVITPTTGCGSVPVILIGTGFGDGATVTFDGVAATGVNVITSNSIQVITPAHANGAVDVVVTNPDGISVTYTSGFTYGTPWWIRRNILAFDGNSYIFQQLVQQCTPPSGGVWEFYSLATPDFTWHVPPIAIPPAPFVYQPDTPGPGWIPGSPPVNANGWYFSSVGFLGSVGIANAASPHNPRTWDNISGWAVNNTGCLGGSPAASCVTQNRMLYPTTGYTVGTQPPPIRIFDGVFDHEICQLPPTVTNGVPQAVISMLAADGTVFLSSWDSGTSSTTWLGRVFTLDIISGQITPLGVAFPAGELPYALAWHMGRLWCGTNNGTGTTGKVYYFRPGIDTAWVLDQDLSSNYVGGVDSLLSYGGNLYVGTDNAPTVIFSKTGLKGATTTTAGSVTADQAAFPVNSGAYTGIANNGSLIGTLVVVGQPDVARNVLISFSNPTGGNLDLYAGGGTITFTVTGTFRGSAQSDTIVFTVTGGQSPIGANKNRFAQGVKPFDTITSITYDHTAQIAASLYVLAGPGSRIGLPRNRITPGDGDVTTFNINGVPTTVAGAFSDTNHTVETGTTADTWTLLVIYQAANGFAQILRRDSLGVYTSSLTGSGGTATANNGFLAMATFDGDLYASYFNKDSTVISKIYKFDGSSWTTVYTGASTTLRSFIGLLVDNGLLYAIGGGMHASGALVRTPDGTTWTDLTPQLPTEITTHTLLPIYGVEVT